MEKGARSADRKSRPAAQLTRCTGCGVVLAYSWALVHPWGGGWPGWLAAGLAWCGGVVVGGSLEPWACGLEPSGDGGPPGQRPRRSRMWGVASGTFPPHLLPLARDLASPKWERQQWLPAGWRPLESPRATHCWTSRRRLRVPLRIPVSAMHHPRKGEKEECERERRRVAGLFCRCAHSPLLARRPAGSAYRSVRPFHLREPASVSIARWISPSGTAAL